MASSPKQRKIVDTDRFEKERAEISRLVKRLDEALEGVDFRLKRRPESGFRLGPWLWATAADLWDGQSIAVYYTFDEATVTRHSIRLERLVG
ncbi:MAG TPA: hypothetical protein VHB47_10735 [Thermoanaerobaculia bacterium]|nr:hypothetical protein [Thermoanaerobaculia bacterium]